MTFGAKELGSSKGNVTTLNSEPLVFSTGILILLKGNAGPYFWLGYFPV